MWRWIVIAALVPSFVSCSEGEATSEAAPVAVVGVPAPAGGGGGVPAGRAYVADWSRVPEGQAPPELVDVRQDGHRASFLYDGGWRVAHAGGRAVLSVPFALTDPPEPLSFRRYDGNAFGPGGQLPARYRIEAEARSLGGSARFRGYGEVAIQAVYLSPITYVEVLQTDSHLVIWQAKDAPPGTGKGWTPLAKVPHPAKVGQWLRFGAEVDTREGTITALLDGKPVARGVSRLISTAKPPHFTIRATGNREEWRSLSVRELP